MLDSVGSTGWLFLPAPNNKLPKTILQLFNFAVIMVLNSRLNRFRWKGREKSGKEDFCDLCRQLF